MRPQVLVLLPTATILTSTYVNVNVPRKVSSGFRHFFDRIFLPPELINDKQIGIYTFDLQYFYPVLMLYVSCYDMGVWSLERNGFALLNIAGSVCVPRAASLCGSLQRSRITTITGRIGVITARERAERRACINCLLPTCPLRSSTTRWAA